MLLFLKNTAVINIDVMWNEQMSMSCHKCVCHVWSIPKIIGPERNVSLICSWSLCTHIPQIKSISPSRKKWWQLITRPKIIGSKRNVNFICIIHSHTKYQVNISKHSKKKWWQLFYFGITELGNTICPSHLVAGTSEITLMSLM